MTPTDMTDRNQRYREMEARDTSRNRPIQHDRIMGFIAHYGNTIYDAKAILREQYGLLPRWRDHELIGDTKRELICVARRYRELWETREVTR